MKYGIFVGAEDGAVAAVSKVVLAILSMPNCDEKTKQMALKALGNSLKVEGTNISNVNITDKGPK